MKQQRKIKAIEKFTKVAKRVYKNILLLLHKSTKTNQQKCQRALEIFFMVLIIQTNGSKVSELLFYCAQ